MDNNKNKKFEVKKALGDKNKKFDGQKAGQNFGKMKDNFGKKEFLKKQSNSQDEKSSGPAWLQPYLQPAVTYMKHTQPMANGQSTTYKAVEGTRSVFTRDCTVEKTYKLTVVSGELSRDYTEGTVILANTKFESGSLVIQVH